MRLVEAGLNGGWSCGQHYNIECVEFAADASRQEAIEKAKVHAAFVYNTSATAAVFEVCSSGGSEFDVGTLSNRATSSKQLCDLQLVREGSGQEMYRNVCKELKSVGCTTIDDAANNAVRKLRAMTVFAQRSDKSPDCQGNASLSVGRLASIPTVMLFVVWCFLHRLDLIVQAHLSFLDGWSWEGDPWPVKYNSAPS